MIMQVTQFLHAAILVTDLERARYFYSEVLGLSLCDRPLNFPGLWYQVGAIQLHLMVSDSLLPDQVNSQRWGRNRHLAFAIADLDTAKSQLQAEGYPVQHSFSGRSALFVQDPDGNLIELSQGSSPSP